MNKIKPWKCLLILAISIIFTATISAQPSSSPSFTIAQSAIANGGGKSTGGTFTVDGTIGQAVAGTTSNSGQFSLVGGFLQPALPATAADVSVSGRVLSTKGRGVPRATVRLTEQSGLIRTARANQFGYFKFNGIEAGQVVILTGFSKGFDFSPQVIAISDNVTKIILTASYSKIKR